MREERVGASDFAPSLLSPDDATQGLATGDWEGRSSPIVTFPATGHHMVIHGRHGDALLALDVADGRWVVSYDAGQMDEAAARFVEAVRVLLGAVDARAGR